MVFWAQMLFGNERCTLPMLSGGTQHPEEGSGDPTTAEAALTRRCVLSSFLAGGIHHLRLALLGSGSALMRAVPPPPAPSANQMGGICYMRWRESWRPGIF